MGKATGTKKTADGEDSEESVILNYLKTQNRPYSATDIFNNLHGQVGKTAVVKLLAQMQENGTIRGKVYGKQWVYVARQDELAVASNSDLKALDALIQQLTEDFKTENDNVRRLAVDLSSITTSLSKEELDFEIAKMERALEEAGKRLEIIKSGQGKVDPNEKQKVDKEHAILIKLAKERKSKCTEILNELLDHIPKKREELMEEIGLDMQCATSMF